MPSWPTQADYKDALQNLDTTFRNPELRASQAERTVMGVPKARSGAFASVYKLTRGPGAVALKLFNFPNEDRANRYIAVSDYLKSLGPRKPPGLVGFEYQSEGIRVGRSWYPTLTMEWVKGKSLGEWVREAVGRPRPDVAAVRKMADDWKQLVLDIQNVRIAHGDLQHDNAMVVGDRLVLVDYDGMCVPALADPKRPLEQLEFGKPAYQHPARPAEKLGLHLDHFSAWAVLVALRATAADPGLYARYVTQTENENLLFSPPDMAEPGRSALWPDLLKCSDPEVRDWARMLRGALDKPFDQIPVPFTPPRARSQPGPVVRSPAPAPAPATVPESIPPHFHYEVFHQYPLPIALSYHRVFIHNQAREREKRARVEALVFATEALFRYLICLGLADLFQCAARSGKAFTASGDLSFLRQPQPVTLGKWRVALREVAARLAAEPGHVVPELPAACGPKTEFDRLAADLVSERNQWVHDPAMIPSTESELVELFERLHPCYRKMLWQVRFVRDYVLGYARPAAGHTLATSAVPKQRFHACVGNHVAAGDRETFTAAAGVKTQIPFVLTPDQSRVLYLWPLLDVRKSSITSRDSLYMFTSVTRDRAYLTHLDLAALDARNDIWYANPGPAGAKDFWWLSIAVRNRYSPHPIDPKLTLGQRLNRRTSTSLIGHQFGDYKLVNLLGNGGTGTVYRGVDRGGRSVAVKVLTASTEDELIERFEREFRTMKELPHAHVLRVFDIGAEELDGRDWPYYAMEYAAGELTARIEGRRGWLDGRAPWSDPDGRAAVAEEFRAAATAVAHLHANGRVHRDIKPANFLIVPDDGRGADVVKLGDFGLVKSLLRSGHTAVRTVTGVGVGTEQYWAPEQALGQKKDDPRMDVYSLCVLLAELAAGRRPQHDLEVTTGSTLAGCPELDALPPPLADLIRRGTDRSAVRRFADAAELLAAFEGVASAG